MYIYHPNSIEIPANFKHQRIIPYPPEVTHPNRTMEDVKTIFHDVFVSPTTKKLYCIGPTLYNLKGILFPIKVFINGQEIKLHYYQIERLFFLESSPLSTDMSKVLTINFQFRDFSKKIFIDLQKDENCYASYSDSRLTISTLQKDNHIEWISDWILWHKRLHNVNRVVLYDNGSSNLRQLIQFLPSLEPEVKIILVSWPFPFGVQPYRSAQHGSLNHCRLKFPVSGGYCLNLDLDEYLVNCQKEQLLQYLDQNLKEPSPSVVIFKSKIVPNTVSNLRNNPPRCFDFKFRISHSADIVKKNEQGKYFKYVFKYERTGYNSPHKTRSHRNIRFLKTYGFFHLLSFYVRKIIWRGLKELFHVKLKKPQIDSFIAPRSDFYYFHFMGLTTGWRGEIKIKSFYGLDQASYRPEPTIETLAKKAELISLSEHE